MSLGIGTERDGNSQGPDQTAHMRSLIRAPAICILLSEAHDILIINRIKNDLFRPHLFELFWIDFSVSS